MPETGNPGSDNPNQPEEAPKSVERMPTAEERVKIINNLRGLASKLTEDAAQLTQSYGVSSPVGGNDQAMDVLRRKGILTGLMGAFKGNLPLQMNPDGTLDEDYYFKKPTTEDDGPPLRQDSSPRKHRR